MWSDRGDWTHVLRRVTGPRTELQVTMGDLKVAGGYLAGFGSRSFLTCCKNRFFYSQVRESDHQCVSSFFFACVCSFKINMEEQQW